MHEVQDAITAWIGAAKKAGTLRQRHSFWRERAGAHTTKETAMKDIREADAGHATHPGFPPAAFGRVLIALFPARS